jgi:hypothetical protein
MSADKFVYNEIPTWLVDWINKVYNTVNSIDVLEEFYVGWIPYRRVDSIWTNTVTLNEAPPTWAIVSIDYFKV